jgi:hypothetical protein
MSKRRAPRAIKTTRAPRNSVAATEARQLARLVRTAPLPARSAVERTIDAMHADTMKNIARVEHAVKVSATNTEQLLRARSELLAATKKLDAAQRKLADVDELAHEMASALRQADLSGIPVKPWQFENCAKRLRSILNPKGRR